MAAAVIQDLRLRLFMTLSTSEAFRSRHTRDGSWDLVHEKHGRSLIYGQYAYMVYLISLSIIALDMLVTFDVLCMCGGGEGDD